MTSVSISDEDIKSVAYDNGMLHVEMHDSLVYEFDNVPATVFDKLIKAQYANAYFQTAIAGKYRSVM